MALTSEERKQRLGFGGLARVAKKTRRTKGHVSQVNKNPESRPDSKVMKAITAEIVGKHPDVNPSDIWPSLQGVSA